LNLATVCSRRVSFSLSWISFSLPRNKEKEIKCGRGAQSPTTNMTKFGTASEDIIQLSNFLPNKISLSGYINITVLII